MPNHPYEDDEWISECLCWAGRTQTQICDLGDRFFLPNPGNGGALYVDDFTASPMVSNLFIAFDSYCEYEYGVMGDPEASFQFDLEDLSLDNAIQCVSEVEVMGSPEFCDP